MLDCSSLSTHKVSRHIYIKKCLTITILSLKKSRSELFPPTPGPLARTFTKKWTAGVGELTMPHINKVLSLIFFPLFLGPHPLRVRRYFSGLAKAISHLFMDETHSNFTNLVYSGPLPGAKISTRFVHFWAMLVFSTLSLSDQGPKFWCKALRKMRPSLLVKHSDW